MTVAPAETAGAVVPRVAMGGMVVAPAVTGVEKVACRGAAELAARVVAAATMAGMAGVVRLVATVATMVGMVVAGSSVRHSRYSLSQARTDRTRSRRHHRHTRRHLCNDQWLRLTSQMVVQLNEVVYAVATRHMSGAGYGVGVGWGACCCIRRCTAPQVADRAQAAVVA